jgi:hypothetical protein
MGVSGLVAVCSEIVIHCRALELGKVSDGPETPLNRSETMLRQGLPEASILFTTFPRAGMKKSDEFSRIIA